VKAFTSILMEVNRKPLDACTSLCSLIASILSRKPEQIQRAQDPE